MSGLFSLDDLEVERFRALVVAGICQAATQSNAWGGLMALTTIVAHGGTRRSLEWIIQAVINAINASGIKATVEGRRLARADVAFLMDGHPISSMGTEEMRTLLDALDQREHRPIGTQGDYYTVDDRCYLMYIAPSPSTAEVYVVARGRMAPLPNLVPLQYLNNRVYAALWKQAGAPLPW